MGGEALQIFRGQWHRAGPMASAVVGAEGDPPDTPACGPGHLRRLWVPTDVGNQEAGTAHWDSSPMDASNSPIPTSNAFPREQIIPLVSVSV